MADEVNLDPPVPSHIKELTLEVAKTYLLKKQWTPTEAVLIFSGLDPCQEPFFDADDANEFWLARVIWQAVRIFRPSSQPLSVSAWLDWAINGTDISPRPTPLPYSCELLEANKGEFNTLSKTILRRGHVEFNQLLTASERTVRAQPHWLSVARRYGIQYIDSSAKKGFFPNQETVGDHVAKRFIDEGLKTELGKPPTGSYVKRHALKGLRAKKK